CPGMRIHAIDIVQPPGIGMLIADMRAHHRIVSAVLATKSSAETPRKAWSDARSALVVLVMTPPPDARFVAALGRAIEPLIHAPQAVQSARIGGIGVEDNAVLDHERAHARPFADVSRRVGAGHRRHLGDVSFAARRPPRALAPVVVFNASFALLR